MNMFSIYDLHVRINIGCHYEQNRTLTLITNNSHLQSCIKQFLYTLIEKFIAVVNYIKRHLDKSCLGP